MNQSPRTRSRTVLIVAAAAIAIVGIAATVFFLTRPDGPHAVAPLRAAQTDQNFYFVMADRFANGDPANDTGGLGDDPMVSGFDPTDAGFFQGGDLAGILANLDYIEGLGTTAIWLTPSFTNKPVQVEDSSAGYHGYWVTDFTNIDPHLGTNEDLAELVDAAHERGMKVYFDIITNHTADVIGYAEGDRTAYISKDERPYTDANGEPFDDRAYAGGDTFPDLDAETSFPYVPVLAPGEENAKTPTWLNDPTLYHNRGNTTFTGEDSLYGDFFGLDDLFTEHPAVVDGMIDIYTAWIRDFDIDGFRIDTMRHVDDAFWQRFGPEVLEFAHEQGKDDFFMFGEVFDTSRPLTSHFTTTGNIQAVLDFSFQDAARTYASRGGSAQVLADLFTADDWYTDADSNAYQLPTFLGNHDMGRIGGFIASDNPNADDAELLQRDKLAHALMYFSRGNPVIYYGDEQGFTGEGADKAARQPMFATAIEDYVSLDLIGTDATHADDNYSDGHPLYQAIADLARLTAEHPALEDGAMQVRSADSAAGIFAASRIDRDEQREYLVVFNNSPEERTASIDTWSLGTAFEPIYGEVDLNVSSVADAEGSVSVTVPPLSATVFRAADTIPVSSASPEVTITDVSPALDAPGRTLVAAEVGTTAYTEVSFWADAGEGWVHIGTDDSFPYQVFHNVTALAPGVSVEYAAVAADNAGHERMSETVAGEVAQPTVEIISPEPGALLGTEPIISASVLPLRPDTSVSIERKLAGGDWEVIGTDDSAPVFSVTDDAGGIEPGTDVLYRAVATQGGATVTSTAVSARGGALAEPDEVALPGTVNSVMGCGEDWAPWCDEAQLTLDPETSTWSITVDLPPGEYEYKIALNRSWDENYGDAGVRDGANIPLTITTDSTVTFTYDNATKLVTVEGAS